MKTLLVTATSILIAASLSATADDKDYQAKFQELDTDGSGSISLEEAREADIDESTFNRFDVNGDGELSEQEFMSMKASKKAERKGDHKKGDHGGSYTR